MGNSRAPLNFPMASLPGCAIVTLTGEVTKVMVLLMPILEDGLNSQWFQLVARTSRG